MSDDIENIRKELEEVRKLKDELRKEVAAVRRDKEATQRTREEVKRRKEEARRHRTPRTPRTPRPPRVARVKPVKPPKPPRLARVAEVDLNLDGLTDSLDTMMDGLGQQIERSLRGISGLKVPGIRIHKGRRRTKSRKKHDRDIESIVPERVAKIVGPLGNEERLRILDFLKKGGKTFNEIEIDIGKTGSSLTHHLNPLIEAGYVVKGEVRGTYYVTVEGRLAYRLAQWLTYRIERQRKRNGESDQVKVEFDDDQERVAVIEDEDALEAAEEHLEELAEELEEARDEIEDKKDEILDARDEFRDAQEELQDAKVDLEDTLADLDEEEDDDVEDLDDLDWKD
ncbi:MAG: ArsR/SmtB family transcription factor [Candidatus Thorarchaeota archaeon]|jgi:DNA-binding transcriptional ArsR family regulator